MLGDSAHPDWQYQPYLTPDGRWLVALEDAMRQPIGHVALDASWLGHEPEYVIMPALLRLWVRTAEEQVQYMEAVYAELAAAEKEGTK